MPDLNSLVKDVYNIFERPHTFKEENLDAFASGVKEAIRKSVEEAGTKDTKALRMSIIGLPDRKIWFMLNSDTKQTLKPSDYIKFTFGHILEHLLLLLAKEAGHEVTDEQKKVNIGGVDGTMDCKIDGIPVDIKSCSSHAIKKFRNDTLSRDDPFGYLGQISGYAEAENSDEAAFFAVNKEAGDIVLLPVHSMDIIDASSRIEYLKKMVLEKAPPERCYDDEPEGKSGNMALGSNCGWCAFKHECWSDANGGEGLRVFNYANGPKYFTHVAREPRVDEAK